MLIFLAFRVKSLRVQEDLYATSQPMSTKIVQESLFLQNLRALMQRHGLTQKDLAAAVGTTQATISLYLKGKTNPRSSELQKMADYFGMSMDDLWRGGIPPRSMGAEALREENVRLRTSLSVAVGTMEGALATLRKDLETP